MAKEKEQEFIDQMKYAQSQNKQQYKKLAEALMKERQLSKISEALTLDKTLKGKGKKRKMEDQNTGKVSYKWFSQRTK
jgi:transposase